MKQIKGETVAKKKPKGKASVSAKAMDELEGVGPPLSRDGIEVRIFDLSYADLKKLCLRYYFGTDLGVPRSVSVLRRHYQSDKTMATVRRRWTRRMETYGTTQYALLRQLSEGRITVAIKVLVESRSSTLVCIVDPRISGELSDTIVEWRRLLVASMSALYEVMHMFRSDDQIPRHQICIEDLRDKSDGLSDAICRIMRFNKRWHREYEDHEHSEYGEIDTPEPYPESLDEMGPDQLRALLVQLSQVIGEKVVSKMLTDGNGGKITDLRAERVTA